MKTILSLLFVSHSIIAFSQSESDSSAIEKKYDFVEIWGLENQSRKDFLTEITNYPEGICQQSLRKMGYPDGNKILVNEKLLVTIRNNPDYKASKIYKEIEKKSATNDKRKWAALLHANLGVYEKQQLPYFLKPLSANDTQKVDSIFQSLHTEFKSYGINLDKQKIIDAYDVYKESTAQLTKQDVLNVLYFSDNDTLLQAANFVAIHYIKTNKDLVDFLPLLLRGKSNITIALSQFIKDYNGAINWKNHMDVLPALLNNPNPFGAVLALRILDRTGFNRSLMGKLKSGDLITLKEILKSDAIPSEKAFVLSFLNKYSNEPIEASPEAWISKL